MAPSLADDTRLLYLLRKPDTSLSLEGLKLASLSFRISLLTLSSSECLGILIEIISPSSISLNKPPLAASGEICPIDAPFETPLNRPSVISAQELSRPIPASVAVGESISLIPGPPLGPSYLTTTTSPTTTFPLIRPAIQSSSLLKHFAGPSWTSISGRTAPFLTTAPSGHRFPHSMASPPVCEYAFSFVLM